MSKILVDTNVLIYSINKDSEFYIKSQKLLLNERNQFYTTSKNITEFLTVVTRNYKGLLSFEEVLECVNNFVSFIEVVFPNDKSFSLFKKLMRKYKITGLKLHDLEIASISISNNITDIATFNEKDFNYLDEITLVKL